MSWRKGMERPRRRRGFTMVEMLVVVAIIAILVGVSIPMIGSYQRTLTMTRLDHTAQEIYLTAQSRMTDRKNSGTIGLLSGTLLDASGGAEARSTHPLHQAGWEVRYLTQDTAGTLLPAGALESQVEEGSYIIYYEANSGSVMAVLYSDSPLVGEGGSFSDVEEAYDQIVGTTREDRMDDGHWVGWYDGSVVYTEEVIHLPTPQVTINNGEKLTAEITVSIPEGLLHSQITFEIEAEYQGCTGEIVVDTSNPNVHLTSEGDLLRCTVILDSLDYREYQFADWLYHWRMLDTVSVGEDVTVRAQTVGGEPVSGFTLQASDWAEASGNSLFAAYDQEHGVAEVSCGRHLQNLSVDISQLPSGAVTHVVQTGDIDFGNADVEDSWMALYADVWTFHPIRNPYITSFDGTVQEGGRAAKDGSRYTITGLNIYAPSVWTRRRDETLKLGLFEQFQGDAVINLHMEQINIVDAGSVEADTVIAGGFAGVLELREEGQMRLVRIKDAHLGTGLSVAGGLAGQLILGANSTVGESTPASEGEKITGIEGTGTGIADCSQAAGGVVGIVELRSGAVMQDVQGNNLMVSGHGAVGGVFGVVNTEQNAVMKSLSAYSMTVEGLGDYLGGLAGQIALGDGSRMEQVQAYGVGVKGYECQISGGVAGSLTLGQGGELHNVFARELSVAGRQLVGGVAGRITTGGSCIVQELYAEGVETHDEQRPDLLGECAGGVAAQITVGDNSTVESLWVRNSTVEAVKRSGGVAGDLVLEQGVTARSIWVEGVKTHEEDQLNHLPEYAGGVAAQLSIGPSSTVQDLWAKQATVDATKYAGGLAGTLTTGDSSKLADVWAEVVGLRGQEQVGGLAGMMTLGSGSTMGNVRVKDVAVDGAGSARGGLAGELRLGKNSKLENIWNVDGFTVTGAVDYVGGFAGRSWLEAGSALRLGQVLNFLLEGTADCVGGITGTLEMAQDSLVENMTMQSPNLGSQARCAGGFAGALTMGADSWVSTITVNAGQSPQRADYAGGLTGRLVMGQDAKLDSVFSKWFNHQTVKEAAGGIAGEAVLNGGAVENIHVEGMSVDAGAHIGGAFGLLATRGTVRMEGYYATAQQLCLNQAAQSVGGFAGTLTAQGVFNAQDLYIKDLMGNMAQSQGQDSGAGGLVGKMLTANGQTASITVKNAQAQGVSLVGAHNPDYSGGMVGYVAQGISLTGDGLCVFHTQDDQRKLKEFWDAQIVAEKSAGGLVGFTAGTLQLSGSYAATVIQAGERSGGLVGTAAGSRVDIVRSYGSSYLSTTGSDSWSGGLVGYANAGTRVKVDTSFASGAILDASKGAGLIGGGQCVVERLQYSYSAVYVHPDYFKGVVYSIADPTLLNPGNCTQVYALTLPEDLTVIKPDARCVQEVGAKELSAVNIPGMSLVQESHPYNLMGDLKLYPYPVVEWLPHYGDWYELQMYVSVGQVHVGLGQGTFVADAVVIEVPDIVAHHFTLTWERDKTVGPTLWWDNSFIRTENGIGLVTINCDRSAERTIFYKIEAFDEFNNKIGETEISVQVRKDNPELSWGSGLSQSLKDHGVLLYSGQHAIVPLELRYQGQIVTDYSDWDADVISTSKHFSGYVSEKGLEIDILPWEEEDPNQCHEHYVTVRMTNRTNGMSSLLTFRLTVAPEPKLELSTEQLEMLAGGSASVSAKVMAYSKWGVNWENTLQATVADSSVARIQGIWGGSVHFTSVAPGTTEATVSISYSKNLVEGITMTPKVVEKTLTIQVVQPAAYSQKLPEGEPADAPEETQGIEPAQDSGELDSIPTVSPALPVQEESGTSPLRRRRGEAGGAVRTTGGGRDEYGTEKTG